MELLGALESSAEQNHEDMYPPYFVFAHSEQSRPTDCAAKEGCRFGSAEESQNQARSGLHDPHRGHQW
jgi:hypothetical protein